MYQIIIVIHIILGLGIIGLILMQHGKGADAGATFGGGASGSVFGAQGAASFLSRTTAILATLFFVTSLGLAFLNSHKGADLGDLMGSATVEKGAPESGLPVIDGAKPGKTVPAPVENKDLAPSAPAVATDQPAPDESLAPPAPAEQPKTDAVASPIAKEKAPELKKEPEAKADASTKAPEKKK